MEDGRLFPLSARITLADSTVLNLDDNDIMQGGMEFEDAVSGSNSFQIGAVIINKNKITIDNKDGKFDAYDFTGATVVPYVGLQLSETIERLKKGFYTVDEPNAVGGLLILENLDNAHKLERDFSGVTLTFPTTAGNALQVICTYCGIPLATTTFTNWDYMIQSRPVDDALTCIDMVSYIAQLGGNFARCNTDGALEIKWYDMTAFENEDNLDGGYFDSNTPYSSGDNADGGNFTDYNSGDSFDGGSFADLKKFWHLYDFGSTPTVAVDDVVITGIQVDNTDSDNPYSILSGSSGYVINIVNNPLIQSQSSALTIANTTGAKIIGMRFRPFSASHLSNPAIEAGDAVKLSVRTNRGFNTYLSFITSLSYKVNSRESIRNVAETPSRNSSKQYSEQTKTLVRARQNTRQEIELYDLVQQQFNNMVFHSFGLFYTKETLENGSVIEYGHDQPTLAESEIIWKQTKDAFVYSNDGGENWKGQDKDGNILANVLTAIGVNAEWIKVLTSFTVGDNFSVDALGKLTARLVDIAGKITADSGKIGPYIIDALGIESGLIRISENPLFPGMQLRKKGTSGKYVKDEDDNSREMNLQAGYILFETIDSGVKTEVRLIGKSDSFTSIPGSIRISKVDVSGEFEKNISSAEMAIDDTAFIKIMNYTSGVFDSRMELTGQSLTMESYTGSKAIYEFSDGILNISASAVNITGGTVHINDTEF